MIYIRKKEILTIDVERDMKIPAEPYDIAKLVSRKNILAEIILEYLRQLERKIGLHRSQLQVKG